MTGALLLNLRTLRVLWCTPALSVVAMLLAGPKISDNTTTAMVVSSAAAYSVMIWAPLQVLLAFMAVRAAGLSGDDPLPLATSARSKAIRVTSVVAAPAIWGMAGWSAYWWGTGVLAHRWGTSIYLSMILNGFALTLIAVAIGAVLAAQGRPAWLCALASGLLLLALAVWGYIPETPASVLIDPYSPMFVVGGLPDVGRLWLQMFWGACVISACVVYVTRVVARRVVIAALVLVAVAVTLVSTRTPVVYPRAGHVAMRCSPTSGIQICLWSDHERIRSVIDDDVRLARTVIGDVGRPTALREGDIRRPPAGTIPDAARSAAVIPTSLRPRLEDVVASLAAASVSWPPTCSPRVYDSYASPSALVTMVVSSRVSPIDGHPLSWADIGRWLTSVRTDTAACRLPRTP